MDSNKKFRIKSKSRQKVHDLDNILYGLQTKKAIENFPISGLALPFTFIQSIAQIKSAAAKVNQKLGLLDANRARAIVRASDEIIKGSHLSQFPVDVYQTGSGTSTNMNVNEVITTRAKIISKLNIHPNDHVNLGQSSNDVIPTAIHLLALSLIFSELLPALTYLYKSLKKKSNKYRKIIKIGRTHLVDAMPITLGQEFGGYARQIQLGIKKIKANSLDLLELPLGGTAVGTGINTHPKFAQLVITELNKTTKIPIKEAKNHFEAQSAKDSIVQLSGSLKTIAVSLIKIANDIRWLSSGPKTGLNEIILPSLQAGSSIMPGKVNPVLCESVLQVAAFVIGSDTTITLAASLGSNLELNTMMPIIALKLYEMITYTANVCEIFARKYIDQIKVNQKKCQQNVSQSLALVTVLTPLIGYDSAAEIAQESIKTGKTIHEVIKKRGIIEEEILRQIFNPNNMLGPNLSL